MLRIIGQREGAVHKFFSQKALISIGICRNRPGRMKNGIDRVFESFEDKKAVIIIGLLCIAYLAAAHFSDTNVIARILPIWPPKAFAVIAFLTLVIQLAVWKALRHYYSRWYLNPRTLLLLICEFALGLFTVLLMSWPVFVVYRYFTTPHPH